MSVSSIVCVLEEAGPGRAIALTARRLFAKARLRRTLVFAAANLAIPVGCFMVVSVGDFGLRFLHGRIVANVFQTIVGSAEALLETAFGCIFYSDLRVRGEGYDLQLDALHLQHLSETAASEVSPAPSPKCERLWN